MKRHWVTFYDQETGAVMHSVAVKPGAENDICPPGCGWVEGQIDGDRYRIDDSGALFDIGDMSLTVSDGRLSGIPDGASVIVNGERAEVVDGEVRIAGDLGLPETTQVIVHHPLYRLAKVSVPCGVAKGKKAHMVKQDRARLRAADYPAMGDQLDAFAKALDEVLTAMPQLDGPGAQEARAIIGQRNAVKARFPKD